MKFRVAAVRHMLKTDAPAKDDNYDYVKVSGVAEVTRGTEMCEINLYDHTGPMPEIDKWYSVQFEVYINAKKKLALAVRGLTPVVAEARKAA